MYSILYKYVCEAQSRPLLNMDFSIKKMNIFSWLIYMENWSSLFKPWPFLTYSQTRRRTEIGLKKQSEIVWHNCFKILRKIVDVQIKVIWIFTYRF